MLVMVGTRQIADAALSRTDAERRARTQIHLISLWVILSIQLNV